MKKFIFAIIFGAVFILLILLPHTDIDPLPVQALSFLTLIRGGISKSAFGLFSSFAGKSIYAYRVTSLVTPVAKKKNPFKSIENNIKNSFRRYKNNTTDMISFLEGAGAALVFCDFMACYSSPWKNVATIAAILLALRSLGKNDWFLVRFLNSFFDKVKNYTNGKFDAERIAAGMSAGFAVSIPVSFIPYADTCYVVGGALVVTAIIVSVSKIAKKAEKSL